MSRSGWIKAVSEELIKEADAEATYSWQLSQDIRDYLDELYNI